MTSDLAARVIPLHVALGLEVVELEGATATTRLHATGYLRDRGGPLVPGSLAVLADTCCGTAIASALPAGSTTATAQLRVEFVKPPRATTRWLDGRARVDRIDDEVGLSRGEFVDDEDDLVAVASLRSLTTSDRGTAGAVPDWPAATPLADRAGGLTAFLGLLSRSATDGRAEWCINPGPQLTNSYGALHGGMVALLAHVVATDAQQSLLQPGERLVPLDLALNYFRSVPLGEGPIVAGAEISHRGRRFVVADGQILQAGGRSAVNFSVGARISSE